MPNADQDFKSFYKNYTKSQQLESSKQKIMKEIKFDDKMRNGRV